MELDWVMNCELGWFVGPKFLLCIGLGWVGSGQSFGGLGWVKEFGPTNNSGVDMLLAGVCDVCETPSTVT